MTAGSAPAEYPEKPITIVCPGGPATDRQGRAGFAEALRKLGAAVIENVAARAVTLYTKGGKGRA